MLFRSHFNAIRVELLRNRIAIPAELRLKFHKGEREMFLRESGSLSYLAPVSCVAFPKRGKHDAS